MPKPRVFVVVLRRPWSTRDEMRSDPFWEFGSFGITGCHARNLMNSRKSERLEGARLAFAQGGKDGTRLVYLTPPIHVVSHGDCIEATWSPHEKPFRYREAPLLAHNRSASDFPTLAAALSRGKRSTIEGQFASQFRSRTTPLETLVAEELISVYNKQRKRAAKAKLADCYADALPKAPPVVDRNRRQTYKSLLDEARAGELRSAFQANAKRNRALNEKLAAMDCPVRTRPRCNRQRNARVC
jgi:hypothetical protein